MEKFGSQVQIQVLLRETKRTQPIFAFGVNIIELSLKEPLNG